MEFPWVDSFVGILVNTNTYVFTPVVIHLLNKFFVNSTHSGKPVLQAKLIALTWLYLEAHKTNTSQMTDNPKARKCCQSVKKKNRKTQKFCIWSQSKVNMYQCYNIIARQFTISYNAQLANTSLLETVQYMLGYIGWQMTINRPLLFTIYWVNYTANINVSRNLNTMIK